MILIIFIISLVGVFFIRKVLAKRLENRAIKKSLNEFENRKKYSVIDENILSTIEDENLIQAIFDYISEQVIKDDWKNEYVKVKQLPIGFQHIYALWQLEAEVNNGGFNQFFYNPSGQYAEEAYQGAIAIGAKRLAEIIKNAVDTLMEEKELHLKTRKAGTLEAFSESYKETKLGKWDDEFYKYSDNIQNLEIKYIHNNIKDFKK